LGGSLSVEDAARQDSLDATPRGSGSHLSPFTASQVSSNNPRSDDAVSDHLSSETSNGNLNAIPARTQTMRLAVSVSRTAADALIDHPDHDYYGQSSYVRRGVSLAITIIIGISLRILALVGSYRISDSMYIYALMVPTTALFMIHYLLWSFMIEGFFQQGMGAVHIGFRVAHCFNFALIWVTVVVIFLVNDGVGTRMLLGYTCSYWVVAILKVCWAKSRKQSA
jgi:hypothetical protein